MATYEEARIHRRDRVRRSHRSDPCDAGDDVELFDEMSALNPADSNPTNPHSPGKGALGLMLDPASVLTVDSGTCYMEYSAGMLPRTTTKLNNEGCINRSTVGQL
jgi:hypothetical protein